MASDADAPIFEASLGCLIAPATEDLAARLHRIAGLDPAEREILLESGRSSLVAALHRKLARLLVLELNLAREKDLLEGQTSQERWDDFLQASAQPEFWADLESHYPGLMPRIERVAKNGCRSVHLFARHWAADRSALMPLLGSEAGRLKSVSFGSGDTHKGGLTVATLSCDGGDLAYKPRSLNPDVALRALLAELESDLGRPLPISVPAALSFEDHGWAVFVRHRKCAAEAELALFYRGIGQWLGLLRLLGGTDIHSENLIAAGASAVVVDCETLFTPKPAPVPSGFGAASDRAEQLVGGTVLATGLLPGRGQGLGWRGIDTSAAGSIPAQQPVIMVPDIVGAGTDEARIEMVPFRVQPGQNHPSDEASLVDHWPEVLSGFDEISALVRRLDGEGRLEPRLRRFEDCEVRVVVRQTEVYAELGRMLWHPVSLHDPEAARARARDLLGQMGRNVALAPDDPGVIEAEIDDLLVGDVPIFTGLAREGVLNGPGGTTWLAKTNLVEDALRSWRAADLSLEHDYVRMALVSAYVNDGWFPSDESFWPTDPPLRDLDRRRRRQAAELMGRLVSTALHGEDGTATWIAPTLTQNGWAVQPLDPDLYAGLSGLALVCAAHLSEEGSGRADPVQGLGELYAAILRTLDKAEDKQLKQVETGALIRPLAPGGYLGLGSRIFARLALAELGMDAGEGVDRAERLAGAMAAAAEEDEVNDVIEGRAGAIPPLLALARRTGKRAYLDLACAVADGLLARGERRNGHAYWTHRDWPEGIGGVAHGVTGIGWSLFQLARETGREEYRETAEAAFAFEAGLYDETEGNWRDLRLIGPPTAAAWCHGSVGIGLAWLDLDPATEREETRRVVRRAAEATWRLGMGWNHCACHGDVGAWELLDRAAAAGLAPAGVTGESVLAGVVATLERQGPVCGIMRDAYVPGLLPGYGGVAYQLLRAHPESRLPSILTLGGAGF
jgi:type 2 lantibiotic biosynthesis protein LanM